MGVCYMAEINLGMDGMSRHPERIEEAISFFRIPNHELSAKLERDFPALFSDPDTDQPADGTR